MTQDFEPSQELKSNYYGKPLTEKKGWYREVSQAYDRVRPSYGDDLISKAIALAQLSPQAKILEIGSGPGTATVSFAKRGYKIVGLEPNSTACQIANQNCREYPDVEVLPLSVEEWEPQFNEFAAVVAASSLHWVAPNPGYAKIAQALKSFGSLILLWNTGFQPSDRARELISPIYQTYAPALKPVKGRNKERKELKSFEKLVVESGYFQHLTSEELMVEVTYSIEDYLSLLSTYSPYIMMNPKQRQDLFTALENCLQKENFSQFNLSYLSILQVFKKNS